MRIISATAAISLTLEDGATITRTAPLHPDQAANRGMAQGAAEVARAEAVRSVGEYVEGK